MPSLVARVAHVCLGHCMRWRFAKPLANYDSIHDETNDNREGHIWRLLHLPKSEMLNHGADSIDRWKEVELTPSIIEATGKVITIVLAIFKMCCASPAAILGSYAVPVRKLP